MHDNTGSVTINRSTLFNTGVLPKPEFTHDEYLEFMRSGKPYTDTPIFFNKLCPFADDYDKLFNINWKDALFHQYQVLAWWMCNIATFANTDIEEILLQPNPFCVPYDVYVWKHFAKLYCESYPIKMLPVIRYLYNEDTGEFDYNNGIRAYTIEHRYRRTPAIFYKDLVKVIDNFIACYGYYLSPYCIDMFDSIKELSRKERHKYKKSANCI
jgi:hypothetical protein